jgi:hypothetical protein
MRAEIHRWDEQAITGRIESDVPVILTVKIGGREVGELAVQEPPDGGFANFWLNTTYLPAACLGDVRLSAEGILLAPPDAKPVDRTNATYHSAFGGMWIDRSDWQEVLDQKVHAGEIGEALGEQIRGFVRDGFIIIPNAVPHETLSQLNADVDDVWSGNGQGLKIEAFNNGVAEIVDVDPKYARQNTKLLDAYQQLDSARRAAAAPAAVKFMTAVFEDKPKAFQQLHFMWGSNQPIHKDSAYVKIDGNPMSMVASWLALEDVKPGTGELEYYVGSHRAPDYIFGGFSKWMEAAPAEHMNFLAALHTEAEQLGFARSSFLPKAGDLLLWHADLAHGGSTVRIPGVTRKSLVTHFTAARNKPYYSRHLSHADHEEGGVVFTSSAGSISPRKPAVLNIEPPKKAGNRLLHWFSKYVT